MKYKKLYMILLICISLFTIGQVHKTFENDTFFTIPTGDYILEHGINEEEPLTFHEGLKYTKLRWAFDIIVSLIYKQFGFDGLYIFTVIMSILLTGSLYTVMAKLTNSKIIPFILTLMVAYACSGYYVCRAQIVSYTIFIWEIYFLLRLTKTAENRYIIALAILSYVLLAFHSSVWLVYLVFFIPVIAEWIISVIIVKGFNVFSEKLMIEKIPIKKVLIALSVVLLTGLCTPLGLNPYTYSIKSFGSIAGELVTELQPLQLVNTPALYVPLILLILITVFTKSSYKASDLFYFLGGMIMAMIAERNLYIALPIMAIAFCNIMNYFLETYQLIKNSNKFEAYLDKHILIDLLLMFLFVIYLSLKYKSISSEEYINKDLYPVGATNFIKEKLDIDNMRIYTGFDYGSYLELNGIKVFLDSRTEIYCEEFNHVSILSDWANIFRGSQQELPNTLDYAVDKYQLTHILCYASDYFVDYMKNSKEYHEIYSDENFMIFKVD